MYTVVEGKDEDTVTAFLRLPRRVYEDDPNYVPEFQAEVRRQLDEERNPFFRANHLKIFVCLHDATPVARASLVWPKDDACHPRRAMFGYLECVGDMTAFQTLLAHVEVFSRANGINTIEGPFSPCQYGVTGIQVDGFGNRPAFLEPYNPPYYKDFLLASGFLVSQAGRTWRASRQEILHATAVVVVSDVGEYQLRTVQSLSSNDIRSIAAVIEPAFRENWGSVPISLEEYAYAAEGLAPAFDPGLVLIVEHHGNPIGAMIMLLDINEVQPTNDESDLHATWLESKRSDVRSLVVYAMGVVPEHRHTRAALTLACQFRKVVSCYETITSTWITRGNSASELLAKRFGFRPSKTFEVYLKNV